MNWRPKRLNYKTRHNELLSKSEFQDNNLDNTNQNAEIKQEYIPTNDVLIPTLNMAISHVMGRGTHKMSHVDGVDDGVSCGVRGQSSIGGHGVLGISDAGNPPIAGVSGISSNDIGVYGISNKMIAGVGVYGESKGVRSRGVFGNSVNSIGVQGRSEIGWGMLGQSDSGIGVQGSSNTGTGVYGNGFKSYGVRADSVSGIGVEGMSRDSFGVSGVSRNFIGVYGQADSDNQAGVLGITTNKVGVGVAGTAPTGSGGFAGFFAGDVKITGNLQKSGGSFKIDHPLDPANKYLSHSFVESPEMKNIYDGVVALDENGEAEIDLPDWFAALNASRTELR